MYGVYTTVTVEASAYDPSHTPLLTQIVPAVQATPGVVGGYWLEESETKASALVLFDSEESARAAISAMGVEVGGELMPGVVFDAVEVSPVLTHF